MSETNQAVLLDHFAGQYTVKFNDVTNRYYITSDVPFNNSKYYLRKDGNLHISTFWHEWSEGYWDTEQEADDFLASWLSGAQV